MTPWRKSGGGALTSNRSELFEVLDGLLEDVLEVSSAGVVKCCYGCHELSSSYLFGGPDHSHTLPK